MTRRSLLCLATLLCAVSALGQDLGSAVLSGDVTDPAGAAVVGAEVTAQSKATAVAHGTTTNGAGHFVLNQLAPGDYSVSIGSKGFGPTVTQVQVEVGQQQSLKIKLQMQAAQTSIDISAAETGRRSTPHLRWWTA
jgi:hypothetical protein